MSLDLSNIDKYQADSLAHQRAVSAGPLRASLQHDALEIDNQARITLPQGSYAPMIQLAPLQDLDDTEIQLTIRRILPFPATGLDPAQFAAFSEAGSFLTVFVPPTDEHDRTTLQYRLQLSMKVDGRSVARAQINTVIQARLTQGRYAKLLHIMQAETPRIRRLSRSLMAQRQIRYAKGFMLDRIGRELSVPRFEKDLRFRRGEFLVTNNVETDAAYRRRLEMFRRFVMPTRGFVDRTLNGANGQAGLLQKAGAPTGFEILESDNPFMSGMQIISCADTTAKAETQRNRFLTYIRDTKLLDPLRNVRRNWQLPSRHRQAENELRERLRDRLDIQNNDKAHMAPYLARAFDRLAQALDHLGIVEKPMLFRAFDPQGGHRFELGLGAEIKKLSASTINQLRNRINAGPPALSGRNDIDSLLIGLGEADLTDPSGSWLFKAAGFRTFEFMTASRIFVSHVSLGNVTLDMKPAVTLEMAGQGVEVAATLKTRTGNNDAALQHALRGGPGGLSPDLRFWTALNATQTNQTIEALVDPGLPGQESLDKVGLSVPADMAVFPVSLSHYPRHQFAILRINSAMATNLRNNVPAAYEKVEELSQLFGANGASSLALLGSGAELVLIVGATGLPQTGTNIGPRRSSDFFWNVNTVSGGEAVIKGTGSRALFKTKTPGVYVVNVLAYSRIGLTDPFAWDVRLPRGAVLNFEQYELFMNYLSRLFPIGVEINTWDIRRNNVAFEGDDPVPLSPKLSRSFRPFHRYRFAGTGDAPNQSLSKTKEI